VSIAPPEVSLAVCMMYPASFDEEPARTSLPLPSSAIALASAYAVPNLMVRTPLLPKEVSSENAPVPPTV
jgi:hypothetical protein